MALNEWEERKYGVISWQKTLDKNLNMYKDGEFLVSIEQSSRYRDSAYVVKVIKNKKLVRTSRKYRLKLEAIKWAMLYMEKH